MFKFEHNHLLMYIPSLRFNINQINWTLYIAQSAGGAVEYTDCTSAER